MVPFPRISREAQNIPVLFVPDLKKQTVTYVYSTTWGILGRYSDLRNLHFFLFQCSIPTILTFFFSTLRDPSCYFHRGIQQYLTKVSIFTISLLQNVYILKRNHLQKAMLNIRTNLSLWHLTHQMALKVKGSENWSRD